jgi:putative CRISPR-associated protein (TIGR02619 family)
MKIIVSTVGTSIFTNLLRESLNNDYKNFNKLYNYYLKDDIYEKDVKEYIQRKIRKTTDVERLSAELKSLSKIGVNEDDYLYFFSTDTKNGKLSGEIIKDYFKSSYKCRTHLEVIKGLQVKDPKTFEQNGVKNLIEKILDIIERYPYTEIIFNPTGGFKGVVPYITIAGMLFSKKITYIFENTDGLITLPPLPITFDFDIIDKYKHKFAELKQREVMKCNDFFYDIDYYHRDIYAPFIIKVGNEITFSALGELVYKRYLEMNKKLFVLISKEANKYYKNIEDAKSKEKINKLLKKIANPKLRKNNEHEKINESKTDLYILKEGTTSERVFYYIKSNIPRICLIKLKHDEYEQCLNSGKAFKRYFNEDEFEKYIINN